MGEQRWFHPRGTLARDGWQTAVDARLDGWQHTGLKVAELDGGSIDAAAGDEKLIVPLAGSFSVTLDDGARFELAGRASVFDGPTDVLYVASDRVVTIAGTGRVAVAASPTDEVLPTRHISAAETPVELRGSGASSRQVHNFGTPQALDAARFIVCEVITPSENWSSYPPHKHDEHDPGHESRLEEIYYFESAPTKTASGVDAAAAFGMFSTYSSPAGSIDINAQVRTGDVALVPYGYHGPAVAAPGYDLYYLNVMAGPDAERVWNISDDPAHAWVRESWEGQPFDDRLPYESTKG
ncbi:5-deoxy-glucuronate isomerase [Microbacterium halophytorum]|uniref:5-deoxy-glucuronate isomerase n=1 Tax=Microbacterium halophytorum TaxID=2067568 RepID=UPI000CFAFDB7|nr:5-deoxy-glucuronate isomerase [Microbacterium halophytorum]